MAFVGEVDLGQVMIGDYQFSIATDGMIYERKARLDKFFEEVMMYLCVDHIFVY